MPSLTREQLASRILALPSIAEQTLALRALEKLILAEDNVQERLAEYAGHPIDYFREVLGVRILTPDQEKVLRAVDTHDRVLIAAANGVGKTHLLGGVVCYFMGPVACQVDPDTGEPQRARVLLPGPNHKTVFATVYTAALQHAQRAAERGFPHPGAMSTKTVRWMAGPGWEVEAFSPPRKVGERAAHAAGGRHARNQVAVIEEGAGCSESLWKAVEGMCSTDGNKILSPFNPTEINNPAYIRAQRRDWLTIHISALDHPNVLERRGVIPEARGHQDVERKIREECEVLGEYPSTLPDSGKDEFLYALPPKEVVDDEQPRDDGVPGHAEGTILVYRPSPAFQGQVLGRWPEGADGASLFSATAWAEAVERWMEAPEPPRAPDRVGVDLARTGADEIFTTPSWGPTAAEVLQRYRRAIEDGDERTLQELKENRIRVGMPERVANGDGVEVASDIDRMWPSSVLVCDEGGVGASAVDHLSKVLGRLVVPVAFAAKAFQDSDDEPFCEDTRTQMYWRLARLVKLGLVDVPPDPMLREEILAHRLGRCRRVIDGERREAIRLESKTVVRSEIGRSPDRTDSVVLSPHEEVQTGWTLTSVYS